MSTLAHTLSMYWRFLNAQMRSQMQFRASFWADAISTFLLNGVFFLTVALVIGRFGSIGGWALGEIAFLAGLIETSFGLMDLIFSGFDYDNFSLYVQMGTFDQFLLRPVSPFWQVLGSRFVLRRLGRITEGLVIFAISLSLIDVQWTALKLLYLPVVILSQVAVMGGLFVIGSTLTFWLVQSTEAMNILTYGGVEMMTYPAHIFPAWLRGFYIFVVPLILLNYYPALYILDRPDPLGLPAFMPFLAPVAAGLFFFLALQFWRVGINHYQSTGS